MLKRCLCAAVALAALCGCQLDDPLLPIDVFQIDVLADSLAADGVSRTPVVVTLLGDTPVGTVLTLKTESGSFLGAPANARNQITVRSASKVTEVTLISGTTPGSVAVSASADSFAVRDTVYFRPAPPDELDLSVNLSRARANGQDAIQLTALLLRAVGTGQVSQGTRVRFDVFDSAGRAVPELSGIGETDQNGRATRSLVTRVPDTYRVIASADEKSDAVEVQFTP